MSYNGTRVDNCVCDVVGDIILAQNEVADSNGGNGSCSTSCERSVRDLLSPQTNNNVTGNTTVPFILYCAGDCTPFLGSGVYQAPIAGTNNTYFGCVESPIFRAINFIEDSTCCVRLELLLPATAAGATPGPIGGGVGGVCPFFPDADITDFQATGICLTVDLNHYHAITCLDPITPLPASQFPGA